MRWQVIRLGRLAAFAAYFLKQMVVANWEVATDVLTPGSRMTPGIVAVPLRCRTRGELTLLSDLITLTPGTLTLEVDRGAHVLYVLGLYAPDDPDAFRAEVVDLERRMLHATRIPRTGRRHDEEARR